MYKLVVLFSVVCLAVAKPSVGVVPLAYSSVLPATSSLSQYSSSVLHGAPVASVYGAPVASVYGAPVASVYGAPFASVYSAPVSAYSPAYTLSQAPHSPAVVLDAVNGVPLDTPEVVAARAAHYQAKALSGLHHLKKRSLAVAPVAYSSVYSAPVVSAYSSSVVSPYAAAYQPIVSAYSTPVVASPLAYHGVVPKALSVHPW